jgi:hypothetical protein
MDLSVNDINEGFYVCHSCLFLELGEIILKTGKVYDKILDESFKSKCASFAITNAKHMLNNYEISSDAINAGFIHCACSNHFEFAKYLLNGVQHISDENIGIAMTICYRNMHFDLGDYLLDNYTDKITSVHKSKAFLLCCSHGKFKIATQIFENLDGFLIEKDAELSILYCCKQSNYELAKDLLINFRIDGDILNRCIESVCNNGNYEFIKTLINDIQW